MRSSYLCSARQGVQRNKPLWEADISILHFFMIVLHCLTYLLYLQKDMMYEISWAVCLLKEEVKAQAFTFTTLMWSAWYRVPQKGLHEPQDLGFSCLSTHAVPNILHYGHQGEVFKGPLLSGPETDYYLKGMQDKEQTIMAVWAWVYPPQWSFARCRGVSSGSGTDAGHSHNSKAYFGVKVTSHYLHSKVIALEYLQHT